MEGLLKSELDEMHKQGRPLIIMIEMHPHYAVPDEMLYNACVNFLDYAVEQNARFMSTAELVERFGRE